MEGTRIFKSLNHGWEGLTEYKDINGYDWRVTTLKRSGGKLVSIARAGKISDDGGFSFSMFSDPSITLLEESSRATEKTVKELHFKALAAFDILKENGELPENKVTANKEYEIKVGQILFLNGYGQSEFSHDRRAVYDIEVGKWGDVKYYCVNLENLALTVESYVRPIEEKFGIGIYYKKGDVVDLETVTNAVIEAKAKQKKDNERAESDKLLQQQARAGKVDKGKDQVNVPKWAKSVIIAQFYENHSDSMTDYFHASADKDKTLYLAFSKSTRNNMKELRQAAALADETKQFGPGFGIFKPYIEYKDPDKHYRLGIAQQMHPDNHLQKDDSYNQIEFNTLKEAEEFVEKNPLRSINLKDHGEIEFKWEINEERIENRDSGYNTPGFYVGTSSWSGWKVSKLHYKDIHDQSFKDQLAVAAAEGRYRIKSTKSNKTSKVLESASLEGLTFTLKETTHAKKNIPLYVAVPDQRVSKDDFKILSERAKHHGGYYSRFKGNGAIPGYQFTSKDDRTAFINNAIGKEARDHVEDEWSKMQDFLGLDKKGNPKVADMKVVKDTPEPEKLTPVESELQHSLFEVKRYNSYEQSGKSGLVSKKGHIAKIKARIDALEISNEINPTPKTSKLIEALKASLTVL